MTNFDWESRHRNSNHNKKRSPWLTPEQQQRAIEALGSDVSEELRRDLVVKVFREAFSGLGYSVGMRMVRSALGAVDELPARFSKPARNEPKRPEFFVMLANESVKGLF